MIANGIQPETRKRICTLLHDLVEIPSPSGYTDQIVHHVGEILTKNGVHFELTRRGAIRATIPGKISSPDRAVVAHLDTLGAMVRSIKPNGRLEISPIGHWSARFAEGGRVTIFNREGSYRGSVLPLKASGHTYNEEIDQQPCDWRNLEVRVDIPSVSAAATIDAGFEIGDYIAFDPGFEISPNGFINSRHLDDKAGVAVMLATIETIAQSKTPLPVDCHFLFTIFEEVGSGASAVLHGDVAEMVSIDNSTVAPGQNSIEDGVTICMMDSTGPFDYHLTHKLADICRSNGIRFAKDIFRYYRSDSAAALEAGNDIRTALLSFGCDASHGYERTHVDSLTALHRLLTIYLQSPPTFMRDRESLNENISNFPTQPTPEPEDQKERPHHYR